MIHIGQIIEAEVRSRGLGITWFAKELCCDRTNVYSIFKRPSIDTAMLMRVCVVLDRNFFEVYCQELATMSKCDPENEDTP
ncbi:MAG: XRE family transcriptional regulator [Rikenellaceae bacterium]